MLRAIIVSEQGQLQTGTFLLSYGFAAMTSVSDIAGKSGHR
jgi:hypothetical protein